MTNYNSTAAFYAMTMVEHAIEAGPINALGNKRNVRLCVNLRECAGPDVLDAAIEAMRAIGWEIAEYAGYGTLDAVSLKACPTDATFNAAKEAQQVPA